MAKRTDIALVLDCSGSMWMNKEPLRPRALYDLARQEIARTVDALENPGVVRITEVFFASDCALETAKTHKYPKGATDLAKAVMTRRSRHDLTSVYLGGGTELFKAVDRAIHHLRPHDNVEGNCAFLVLVLTDGETAAHDRHAFQSKVAQLVRDLTGGGHWTFGYFACGDARLVETFPNERMLQTPDAMRDALGHTAAGFLKIRETGVQQVGNLWNEVAALDAGG